MRRIDEIIIHCSDSTFGSVNRIRGWHVNERGFSDIAYHYVIANGKIYKDDTVGTNIPDGFIEEGRPLHKAGAHCRGHNSHSIGICMIGVNSFSEAQHTSLKQLLIGLMEQYDIIPENIKGHYEYSDIKTCPNFDVSLIREELKD